MNEYLNEVVDHLQEIPEDDRFDLIQYYEEYLVKNPKRQIRLIWLIIIGLFASPVLIPLALGFILVIGGLLVALLALIFSIYVLCISILGVGLFMIISGISVFGQSILSGLFFIGVGLFATGSAVFISPLLLKGTKGLFYVMMNFVKWMGRRFITKRDLHSAGV